MALSAIKANVTVAAGLANNQLEALALGAANRSPSQAYKTEANKYAYNNNPDMDIINNEVEKANTAGKIAIPANNETNKSALITCNAVFGIF